MALLRRTSRTIEDSRDAQREREAKRRARATPLRVPRSMVAQRVSQPHETALPCPPVYLTVKDLAPHLQVKPSTLYAWVAQGKIPVVKIHGLIRFRRDEIEQWLESFRRTPLAQRATRRPTRKIVPDLDPLIARAKRAAYTPAGETRPRSGPERREEKHGAV